METRPKLKFQLTFIDRAIELLGFLILIAYWVWVIVTYSNLPNVIPIHFDAVGKVDGFGRKGSIFDLPVVATVIFIVFTVINRYPHIFNYPVKIRKDNALRQYINMTRMIRVLKLMMVVMFFLITFKTTQISAKESNELGIWFLPLTLGMTFLPIIYFVAKSFKEK